jgi:hypothetical protein
MKSRIFKLSHNLVTGATGALLLVTATSCKKNNNPNVIFVFADQWRAQDVGWPARRWYSGMQFQIFR